MLEKNTSTAVSVRGNDTSNATVTIAPNNVVVLPLNGIPRDWFTCMKCGQAGWRHTERAKHAYYPVCDDFLPGRTTHEGVNYYWVNDQAYYEAPKFVKPFLKTKGAENTFIATVFALGWLLNMVYHRVF